MTPLKMFNLNSKNLVGKAEYFDKLMAELKILMKSKQKESDCKNKRVSHENVDPESFRSLPQPKVQTLIRPQLTNPTVFWSKFEREDFSSNSKNVKDSFLEEKVITNFFKPIRSEMSQEVSNINSDNIRGKKKEELTGKAEKSIHESLRIQKTKRRTSLPFFFNDDINQGLIPAVEKVQTYDFSYYSSILKRMNQDKSQYYSSTRKTGVEKSFLIKAASDEKIYEEKQNDSVKEGEIIKSERISVTEPSSPLPSDCLVEVNRKVGSSDSEIDSESMGSNIVVEIKKSKSFVDEKEADGYFKAKSRPKIGTLRVSKTSQSSTSSCDSTYKHRSLQKYPKSKRKGEIRSSSNFEYNRPENQSYVSQSRKYWSEVPEKDVATYRKVSDSEAFRKERSKSSTRDEDLQRIKENVFKHLIEVLMQKNRSEISNKKDMELLSKSLPRNTRRWKNDRYEEECLQVLKSVLYQDSIAKNVDFKSCDRKLDISKKMSQNESFSQDALQRRRKTDDVDSGSRGTNAQRVLMGDVMEKQKNDKISETLPKKKNSRGKLETNLNEECVFTIEDKKLWIEICKAMEKVDGRGKIAKKCA